VRSELTAFGVLDGAQIAVEGSRLASIRTQHATLASRSTNWRLTPTNMGSLCPRGQGCRALGARGKRWTATLHHDLARVRRSEGDRTQALGDLVDRSSRR
jgi:hypothetical protein